MTLLEIVLAVLAAALLLMVFTLLMVLQCQEDGKTKAERDALFFKARFTDQMKETAKANQIIQILRDNKTKVNAADLCLYRACDQCGQVGLTTVNELWLDSEPWVRFDRLCTVCRLRTTDSDRSPCGDGGRSPQG
jgi:hypothetical protein